MPAAPAPPAGAAASLPAGYLPLTGVMTTVRPGGVNVRARPDLESERLGSLAEGDRHPVLGAVFRDQLWLRAAWAESGAAQSGWLAAEFTDFPRSRAYDQLVAAWYETAPVLAFRRALVRDILRVQGADAAVIAQAQTLRGGALVQLEDTLTRGTMVAGYGAFRTLQDRLGLPAPFEHLPVQTVSPARLTAVEIQGFGPTTFAFDNWQIYYQDSRGMHTGLDFTVPEGSPLVAVADGQIVRLSLPGELAGRALALRPYLPGGRRLSNVVVLYGHLTGDPTSRLVRAGDEVRAGQVIGTSGWPVFVESDGSAFMQRNNAHLHIETLLVANGTEPLGRAWWFNPLLFWAPRLVAWQARLAMHSAHRPYPVQGQPWGRLGFFTLGAFAQQPPDPVWNAVPSREMPWPEGVYTLDRLVEWLRTFAPYAPESAAELR